MAVRNAEAVWEGGLQGGKGRMKLGSGAFEGAYSFSSRFEEGKGTNPEELIGAAHAGCFSMALAARLEQAGIKPESVRTQAKVTLVKDDQGIRITTIELSTEVEAPGLDADNLREHAEAAKRGCPVSQALKGVEIRLREVRLV